MREGDLAVIREVPMFAGLATSVLLQLLQGATAEDLTKGRVIFQEGEPAEAFFVVLGGYVKVYRSLPNGEEAIIGIFGTGDSFAEVAVFAATGYPASADAVADARLLRVPSRIFRDRIATRPEIASRTMTHVTRKMRHLVDQVEQLKTQPGAHRLAAFLLNLTKQRAGAAIIPLPYDKALIASQLGMKPESLSRALAKLRTLGVLTGQDSVSVADVSVLADYCNYGTVCDKLSFR